MASKIVISEHMLRDVIHTSILTHGLSMESPEITDRHRDYQNSYEQISLFHHAFQFTICNCPTNELVCNKTLVQMSHILSVLMCDI
jgi:hypothetical protein